MNVQLLMFQIMGDDRGSLISIENQKNIPFDVKRVYYIFGTQPGVRRGCHAHKRLQQVLICLSGACNVLLDDGKDKKEVRLDCPSKGLFIGGCIWRELYNFTEDCVVLVLADEYYDESEYIRDYEEFKKELLKIQL
jgi:dTDP-4-dehydrorhamnose 3,5-epimerase-like enzyme